MLRKRLRKQQNNKGFSLVELIVVVLIIAIIAVALAPQVMKWVGTSKINVDKKNAAALKSSIHAGIAGYMADNSVTILANPSDTDLIIDGSVPANPADLGSASAEIIAVVDGAWPKSQATNNGFRVNITTGGSVRVEYSDTDGSWKIIK